jgi:hypothetical protein
MWEPRPLTPLWAFTALQGQLYFFIVTCLLKTGTVNPEEMGVARQWLCKHISTATSSRDHGRAYTQQMNMSRDVTSASAVTSRENRGIVRSGVLCGWAQRLYLENRNTAQSRECLVADRAVRVWSCCETVAPGQGVEGGGVPIVISRCVVTPS